MAGTRAGALKAWDKRGRKGPHAGVTQAQRVANRIIAKRNAGLSASAIKRKYVLAKGEAIPAPPRIAGTPKYSRAEAKKRWLAAQPKIQKLSAADEATLKAQRILAGNKRMRKRHSVESLAEDIRAGRPFMSRFGGRMW